MEQIGREIDNLRRARRGNFRDALIGGAGAAAGAVGSAIKAVKAASRASRIARNGGQISSADFLLLVPVVGGLTTAALNLRAAAEKNQEIRDLRNRINEFKRRAQVINRDLAVHRDYYRSWGCHNILP